jgi:hypothetical protein
MIALCAHKKILPICEVYDWDDLPKAFDKLAYGKPVFRCCLSVGDWARKNGLHK